jgi:hypothetical protein
MFTLKEEEEEEEEEEEKKKRYILLQYIHVYMSYTQDAPTYFVFSQNDFVYSIYFYLRWWNDIEIFLAKKKKKN